LKAYSLLGSAEVDHRALDSCPCYKSQYTLQMQHYFSSLILTSCDCLLCLDAVGDQILVKIKQQALEEVPFALIAIATEHRAAEI
jgi:hypothetical protein